MTRFRRSPKSEITYWVYWIMKNRPLNHPRVVIELSVMSKICRSMGWDKLNGEIMEFCAKLDHEILNEGIYGGANVVEKQQV